MFCVIIYVVNMKEKRLKIMTLEQEFKTARKNGFQGTRTQFFKLQVLNKAEWLDIYLTSLRIATNFDDSTKCQETKKIQEKVKK